MLLPNRLPRLLLILSLLLQGHLTTSPFPTTSTTQAEISPAVLHTLQTNPTARVIITLRDPAPPNATPAARTLAILQTQSTLLNQLDPTDYHLLHRYTHTPGLAATINQRALTILQHHPAVAAIHLDQPGSGHLGDSVPALQAHIVHNTFGITGHNIPIAVLDTGANLNHPDLAPAIIAQHCFTAGDCPPNDTHEGSSAQDEHGHGTNVTGILTADGLAAPIGFAPGSQIVAVRVLDTNNTGWVSDWIAGLDWVSATLPTTHVRLVNMSLGTFALYPGVCNAQQPLLGLAVSQLRAQGVTLFASTGNEGGSNAIAAPACLSGVIAVGATYDADLGREPDTGTYATYFGGNWPPCFDQPATLQTITCFTNSSPLLDLVAPGARIQSAGLFNPTSTYIGTSQASPTAAGIAALLLQASPNLTPFEIETILEQSGTPLTDPKNGLTFPQINALAAIQTLAIPGVTISGPHTGVIETGYPFTATLLSNTPALPITYTWQATGHPPLTATNGLSHTLVYTWTSPGPKTITVTAANLNRPVTTTHPITLAPAAVTLTGPTLGYTNTPYTFTAAFLPLTTTLPVTYTWQATHQSPLTHTAGLTATATYTWPLTGPITITATLQNPYITISSPPHTLYLFNHTLHLPTIRRD